MTCTLHDATAVCDRCPEGFDTDGKGFPHPAVLKGRKALRVCRGCGQALPLERWNLNDFAHCRGCKRAPATVLRAARSPLNARQWLCELDCGHEVWRSSARKPTAFPCHLCTYASSQASQAGAKPKGKARQ